MKLLDIMPDELKKQVNTDSKENLQRCLSRAYKNVKKTRKKLKFAKGKGRDYLLKRLEQQEKSVSRLVSKLSKINTDEKIS